MRMVVLPLALALTACADGGMTERPGETPAIVSINPCSDQLLEALNADGQIMAVSHWSQDRQSASASPEWARRFPATTGRVEELVQQRPDLVLSGGLMSFQAKAMLADAGIATRDYPVPSTIDESIAQIGAMGDAIGRQDEASALTRQIALSLAHSVGRGGEGKRALVLTDGALSGQGTLIGDMLERMNYRNAAADYGVANLDDMRLELLIADPPDIVFAPPGHRLFAHPALAALHGRVELRPFAERLSWCAGPTMIAMAQALESPR